MLTTGMRPRWFALVLLVVTVAACYRSAPEPKTLANKAPALRARVAIVDPLGYLPMDSEVVVHLDASQLRASAMWPRFEPMMLARIGPTLSMFQTTCGFDPLAAITRISLGMKDLDAPRPGGIIVVRGLDRAATMACYERADAQSRKAHLPPGHTVERGIVVVPGSAGDPPTAFTFADANTLVVMTGVNTSAQALVDVLDGGTPLRGSTAFNDIFGYVEPRDAVWFVINGNSKVFDKLSVLGVDPRAVAGSVSLRAGLAGSVRVRFATPDQATQLAATVQPQVGAVKMFADELEVTSEETDLLVRIVMTQQQVESLAAMLGGVLGTP